MSPKTHNTLSHDFGQANYRPAEKRTFWVAILTVITMLLEIIAGWLTGSMALLADGIHMGGHALALGVASAAYYFTRRNAYNRRFSLVAVKSMIWWPIAVLCFYCFLLFLLS